MVPEDFIRRLKAKWSIEAEHDLMVMHNLTAIASLVEAIMREDRHDEHKKSTKVVHWQKDGF